MCIPRAIPRMSMYVKSSLHPGCQFHVIAGRWSSGVRGLRRSLMDANPPPDVTETPARVRSLSAYLARISAAFDAGGDEGGDEGLGGMLPGVMGLLAACVEG